MALLDVTPKIDIELDLTQSTPRFTFTDKSDYTGASVTFANVKGTLRVTINGDISYHHDNLNNWGSPDMDGSDLGQANEDLKRWITTPSYISLPVNTDDSLVEGSYKFEYNVSDDSGATILESEVTMDIDYSTVTGVLTSEVDLRPTSPSLSVTDATNYIVNSVTPTNVRVLTLYYPANTGAAASVTSASVLTTGSFYVGEQVGVLATTSTYDYSTKVDASATNSYAVGNLEVYIIDSISDTKRIPVESGGGICQINCCISELEDRYNTANAAGNIQRAKQIEQKFGKIAFYISLLNGAYTCGDTSKVNHYIQEIKEECGCNDGCSEETTLITAVTVGNNSTGSRIVFNATLGQATYQSNALMNKIWTPTTYDVSFFVDGLLDYGSFDSTTGTYTFAASGGLFGGELVVIQF